MTNTIHFFFHPKICKSVSERTCLSISVLYLSPYAFIYVFLAVCLALYLPILCIYLFVYLSVCLSLSILVCYLSVIIMIIFLSVCLPICLYLFDCLCLSTEKCSVLLRCCFPTSWKNSISAP